MKTVVVISKYEENVDWTKQINHEVIIYDKSDNPIENSIPRPNIGREAETLCYYIITHYNNLPDAIIFLQADPKSNPPLHTIEECVEEINKNHEIKLRGFLTWDHSINIENNWLKKVPLFHKKIFEDYKVDVKFSLGAQYIIPKENILSKPLDFYELLHKQMLKFNNGLDANQEHFDDGVDAWMMEATWYEIFNPNRKLNINYKENLK
jgi:hypothetical protein